MVQFTNKFKARIHSMIMRETKGEPLDGDDVQEIADYLNRVNGNE
jgi:hypothetical protein